MSIGIFFNWLLKTIAKILGLIFALWLYKEVSMGISTYSDQTRKKLKRKNVVLTGATSGIGYDTAIELAKHGANVYFGCRSPPKGKQLVQEIHKIAGEDITIQALQLNLSSKKSIENFANQVKNSLDQIHILINNAGVAGDLGASMQGKIAKKSFTEDGFELIMGTNYLGHFYLTYLLKDLLNTEENSGYSDDQIEKPSLVLNVSSVGHIMGNLDGEKMDLNMERKTTFSPEFQYFNSKLALIHFTNILARKFKKQKWNTVAASLNPGLVRTNIYGKSSRMVEMMMYFICLILGKNSLQGAQTTIHLAIKSQDCPKEEINGKYFSDCREEWLLVSRQLGNKNIEEKLWKKTEELLKIKFKI